MCCLNTVPIDTIGLVFDLVVTNETQVNKLTSSLRSSKCNDTFQIDTMLIKTHLDILTFPTSLVINLSGKHNTFPDDWKHTIVTPINKSGHHHKASNYRPIRILPVLRKAAEKVVIELTT